MRFFGIDFTVIGTGGGCTALASPDERILITDDNLSAYIGGPKWIVGFYDVEGQAIGYVLPGKRFHMLEISINAKGAA